MGKSEVSCFLTHGVYIYIAQKSKIESTAHYAPESTWGTDIEKHTWVYMYVRLFSFALFCHFLIDSSSQRLQPEFYLLLSISIHISDTGVVTITNL